MIFFKKKNHPRTRYIYAVTAGYYLGELLVYVETKDSIHKFLSLPTMINRDIPVEKFESGVQNKIVDIVEKIPKHVFNVCKLQYQKNNVQTQP